ncbi:MAG: hypothetical protein ACE5KG_01115 [Nitrososphaerales archaeon]
MNPLTKEIRTYGHKPSRTWWLGNRRYFLYMVREFSGFAVALYGFVFLAQLFTLTQGAGAYVALTRFLFSPVGMILNTILLAFAIFHSLTWFDLTAKVQPPTLKGKPVRRELVIAGTVVIWVFISFLVAIFIFRVV